MMLMRLKLSALCKVWRVQQLADWHWTILHFVFDVNMINMKDWIRPDQFDDRKRHCHRCVSTFTKVNDGIHWIPWHIMTTGMTVAVDMRVVDDDSNMWDQVDAVWSAHCLDPWLESMRTARNR